MNMYLCVFITLLAIFITSIIYRKNLYGYTIGSFLISLYSFSVFLTVFNKEEEIAFSIEATLYFILILLLFLIPILKFKANKIVQISRFRLPLFEKLCWFFIISGVFAYFYFIPVIYNLFSSNTSLLTLRTDMVGGERYVEGGLLSNILNLTCQFYPIILVFYFYSITFLQKRRFFNNLLLLSSTAYILNVLSVVGRDGFILWIMSYFFAFLLFKKFMSEDTRKRQRQILIYFVILASCFLVPITIARFFYQGIDEGVNSLIKYTGAQLSNFNNFFNRVDNPEDYGDLTNLFPILSLGSSEKGVFLDEWEYKVRIFGVDPNVFSTFIGSFYQSLGFWATLILAIVAFFMGNRISRKSSTVDFSKMLLITVFSQVVLHGLFYFKLAYAVSNIYIIAVVILSFFFRRRIRNV